MSSPPRLYINGMGVAMDILETAPSVTPDELPTSQQIANTLSRFYTAEQELKNAEHNLTPEQR
jgi:hypothetical protein